MITATKYRALLILLVITALLLPMAVAQETTGGIQGYVKDQSGAVVPNAKVEVSSPSMLAPKTAVSDSDGYFRFNNLPVGTYTLTITTQGFTTYKQTGIELLVGKLPTINVGLKVGSVGETVEVSGEAPLVDPTTSKVAVAISEQTIQDLPKTRQFYSLIGMGQRRRLSCFPPLPVLWRVLRRGKWPTVSLGFLPPARGDAIDLLRQRGYEVEVFEGPEAPPKKLILEKVGNGFDGRIFTGLLR